MHALEDVSIFNFSNDDEDDDIVADMNNMDTTIQVSHILTTRIYKDHPFDQVIEDLHSTTQTRRMLKNLEEHGFVITIQQRTNYKDLQNCLFACFLSQEEPKKMDVQSAFLYGKIKKEVNVCQPLGFKDPDFLERVYKVKKALYGLHQAPRAWYETLSTYLLDNGFQRGKIDKTLFIKRHKGDILMVQVYLDDIIFGSTRKKLLKQKNDSILISQDKYVTKILKKFGFKEVKNSSTPMVTQKPLLKDEDGKEVDIHMYRSMIGSLMYLTSSRPDIMIAVCACARYQVNPKVSHLYDVKRIFRYLKGQPKLGFWYPKDSPFDLVAYTDSDYAGASLDSKFITGGKAKKSVRMMFDKLFEMELELILLNSYTTAMAKTINREAQIHASVDGKKEYKEDWERFFRRITPLFPTMVVQSQPGEGSTMPTDPHHTPIILQSSSAQPQKTYKPRKPIRKVTKIPQPSEPIEHVTDEAVHKELGDSLCQEAIGNTIAQTKFENLSKLSNDLLLARGNTLRNDKDRLNINELMELCTNLQTRVLDLEKTNTTQANEIDSLKRRVKKLERRNKSRTHKLKRLYKVGLTARVESSDNKESLGEYASKQGRIDDIVADEDITLVNVQANAKMFDADKDLGGEEVFVEQEVVVDKEKIDEVTLAQALAELKTSKPKTKGIVIQEPGESPTTTTIIPKQKSQDKGKGILRKLKKELEANIALIETWNDVRAKIDDDHQLAKRQQVKERQELTDEEKATLFMQFLEKRRKFCATKRAKKKRNNPPTQAQAQKRKIMCTYLRNMDTLEQSWCKDKKETRAREELIQKRANKQKVEDNKETKQLIKIIPDKEEVAIDAILLAVKSLGIIDWKIYKEGKKSYYQIIKADEKSQMYMFFSQMLTSINMEDLEDLYKLVKAKYGSIRPVEDLDLLLWGDLKTMFEPHVKDVVWKKQ
nr:hypothetical protein [Tanacetum cinerariifolium]